MGSSNGWGPGCRAESGKLGPKLRAEARKYILEFAGELQAMWRDIELGAQLVKFDEPTSGGQVPAGICLPVAVAVLSKDRGVTCDAEEFEVEPLHLIVVGSVVVKDEGRCHGVGNEDGEGTHEHSAEDESGCDDR